MYVQVNGIFSSKAFPKRVELIMNNDKRWTGKVNEELAVRFG
jgi:hypothetical protein